MGAIGDDGWRGWEPFAKHRRSKPSAGLVVVDAGPRIGRDQPGGTRVDVDARLQYLPEVFSLRALRQ